MDWSADVRPALDAVPAPIVVVDATGVVLLWNAAATRLLGWAANEMEGRSDPAIPADLHAAETGMRAAVFQGEEVRRETRRLCRDGSFVEVLATTRPAFGNDGNVVAAVTVLEDLTAVRAAEDVVRALQARTETIAANIHDLALLVVAADRRVLEANAAARALLGRGDRPLTGQRLERIWVTEPVPSDRLLEIALESGRLALEARARLPDGSRIWMDAVLIQVPSGAVAASPGEEVVAVLRDVTRERRVQDQQERRALQDAAVANFAQRAMRAENAEELTSAALQHIAAAMQGDVAELLHTTLDGSAFEVERRFTWDDQSSSGYLIEPGSGALVDEAAVAGAPVARPLTFADFQAAPYLAAQELRFGLATSITFGEHACAFAVYSRDRAFDDSDIYALQAIAAMYAAAKARRAAERHLAESEASLRLIFEQIPAILWSVDHNLDITWSQGSALGAIGRTSDDFVGRSLMSVVPDGSPPVRAMRGALRGESTAYRFQYEGRFFDNRVQPLRDGRGRIIGAVALAFDVTERTRAEEALRGSREELRRVSAELNRIQENERRRIARDVHDELGQRLTALRLDVLLLRNALPGGDRQIDERIVGMLALIDETIQNVRRVATALRPAVLDDFGFRAALENELAQLQKRTAIDYSLTFSPDDYTVDGDRGTALFRIVQELLTNVARHADAARLDVRLEARNGWIYLDVRDDGRGIAPADIESGASLGLVGVRERAFAFGGDVLITNIAGGGTHVAVRIPEREAE